MKKILLLSAFLTLCLGANAQTNRGDISIGGGLAYGTGAAPSLSELNNSLGIQLGGFYTLTDSKLRAGLDFIYYFPDKESGVEFKLWELNANLHYIFLEESDYFIYGLGGVNISSVKLDYEGDSFFGGGSYSESEFGLNLGAGFEYNLDFANLFAEAKYGNLGGDADQFVLSAGLRFTLD
ncbi:MAG: outer membrane beta-barrel protein [Psychroflexus maritimus]